MAAHVASRASGTAHWVGSLVLVGALAACGGTASSGNGGAAGTGAGGLGSTSTGGASGSDETCAKFCGVLLAAACANDTASSCQTKCAAQSAQAPWCATELAAFVDCAAALPAGTIKCD